MSRLDDFRAALAAVGASLDTRPGFGPWVEADPSGYAHLREQVGIVPMPDRELVRIAGRDRAKFLQGLLTQDIIGLEPGQGCYAAFLTIKGKMQVDLRIAARSKELDDLLIELPYARGASFLAALDAYLFREKVKLHDLTQTHAALLVAGPRALELLNALNTPPPETLHGWASGAASGEIPVDITRSRWLHPTPAWTLWCPTDALARLLPSILERAQALGGGLVSTSAFELARLEAGVPRHLVDTTTETLPLEVPAFADIIHFSKGCYLGQEVIARVDSRGAVSRKLVGLIVTDTNGVPSSGAELLARPDSESPGKILGSLTTVARSPTSQRILALGWVRRGFNTPGTTLDVSGGGQAVVSAVPFEEGQLSDSL